MPRMHPVNPLPRQISQCGEVLVGGKELSLEPEQALHRVLAVFARARVNQFIANHVR